MINVQTYGAVGDGVTDDTAAFVAAIAAGNCITVPATTAGYVITNNLTLSNKNIVGEPGAKILHNANLTLFNITGNNASVSNLIIDSANSVWPQFLLNNTVPLDNIQITKIHSINATNFVEDTSSLVQISNLQISEIISTAPRWTVILLTGFLAQARIKDVSIDYTGSISPDFAAIKVMHNNAIFTSCTISNIDIRGSDNVNYPNQHGLIIGTAEHTNISNISCIYMGGSGFVAQSTINFRITNSNFSFNHQDQMVLNSCSYCQINNCMTRGRANGSLSPLNSSTYGISLHSSGAINISNCDIKSCGAGLWIDSSFGITCTGGQSCVHTYYGIISTGTTASSNISGMNFTYNGLKDVMHTGSKQYAVSCTDSAGNVFTLLGVGTH